MSDKNLSGKIAIVSGGSKGIGKKIAEHLCQQGADCLLLSRSEDMLKSAAAEISDKTGQRVEYGAVDLSTLAGCEQAKTIALEKFGSVDILINCAGAAQPGSFLEQDDATWMSGFDLKFHGAVRLSRALWPSLVERKGTVINIGGGAVYTPNLNFMIGGAVNAALAHFSKSLAQQGLKDDVNVNAVHPGMTVSDRMQMILETQAKSEGITIAEAQQRNVEGAGIRRLGQPEDVAELVAFLCSPQARHIQGVGIAIDGGATSGFH